MRRCHRPSTSGPAERAQMVKASTDICEKKGVLGAGYIPKFDWVEASANSAGLFTYFHYADASFILTCRTPDQTGSVGRDHGCQGHQEHRCRDAGRGGYDKASSRPGPGCHRARQLHRHPRTVPAARYLSLLLGALNAQRGRGAQLHERKEREHAARRGSCSATTSPCAARSETPCSVSRRSARTVYRQRASPGWRRVLSRTCIRAHFRPSARRRSRPARRRP